MAFRDDMIAIVDPFRRDLVDVAFGLRLETTTVRRRQWTGRIGIEPHTDTDVVLDPRPRVKRPTPRLMIAAPGKFETGDLIVDRISATYTEEQLSAGISGASEMIWIVAGEPYRLVQIEKLYLAWRVHLRPMRKRP